MRAMTPSLLRDLGPLVMSELPLKIAVGVGSEAPLPGATTCPCRGGVPEGLFGIQSDTEKLSFLQSLAFIS